jgi:hypothetical protein
MIISETKKKLRESKESNMMFHSVVWVPWEVQAKAEIILDHAEKSKKRNPFISIYIYMETLGFKFFPHVEVIIVSMHTDWLGLCEYNNKPLGSITPGDLLSGWATVCFSRRIQAPWSQYLQTWPPGSCSLNLGQNVLLFSIVWMLSEMRVYT